MTTLRLWVCTDHDTHWPVGGASVVLARNPSEARMYLRKALEDEGLDGSKPFKLIEINVTTPGARVLADGNY